MFAVGIGKNVNRRELRGIASSPADEYMFTVDDYEALDAIKNMLAVRTCKGTIFFFAFLLFVDLSLLFCFWRMAWVFGDSARIRP